MTTPAAIVSNDGANTAAGQSPGGVVTVVPLTTNTTSVFAFQVLLEPDDTGLDRPSGAQPEQVRSVSVGRLLRQVGSVPPSRMARLADALRIHPRCSRRRSCSRPPLGSPARRRVASVIIAI